MSDDIVSRFGQRLRKIRKQNELSQEKLAALAGLARNFISMVETGERNVTIATVEKLANALECRMADLMPDAEEATEYPATGIPTRFIRRFRDD